MKIIDFHTHFVPAWIPSMPAGCAEQRWPAMERMDDRRSRMLIAGRPFRVFDSLYWDRDARLASMSVDGVGMQVISPLPELLSYWMDPDAAEHLTTHVNQGVADLSNAAPDKLIGFGCAVLQDPSRAARQLGAFHELGLRGIHVGSRVNARSIADPAFYPAWEVAEALDLVVLVHGIKPGEASMMIGPALLPNLIGVPHENSMALASFIFTDVLQRFPRLKLVFTHGGGTLGSIIDRLDALWNAIESVRNATNMAPSEYAKRFYYDSAVFSPDYLRFLVQRLGADRFVIGSDGPGDIGQLPPATLLARTGLPVSDTARIAYGNALSLLGA
jgi:aminocarboxymuconate-semialdehyde decarboxylase